MYLFVLYSIAILRYKAFTYEDDKVTHVIRLCWGLLWESADKYEYVTLPYCFGKIAIVAGVGSHEHGINYYPCRLVNLNTNVAKLTTPVWRFSPHCVAKFTIVYSTNYKTVWKSMVWELLPYSVCRIFPHA